MSKEKQKRVTITTPIGVAKYCWLNKPNTKFKPEAGEFSVDLILPADKAKPLIERFTQLATEAKAELSKTDKKIEKYTISLPFRMEEDDDGNETGNVVFKFTQAAKITKKDGSVMDIRVGIFDAKGNKAVGLSIGRGTKMKVAVDVGKQWAMPATKLVGVKYYLKAVQIIDLVEFKGEMDAEACGFGEEDGFTAEEPGATEAVEAAAVGGEEKATEGGDF